MEQISKDNVEKLASVEKEVCISIYISIDSLADDSKNKLKLKNQIQYARKQLQEEGFKEKDILEYLNPFVDLLSDEPFWRKYSKSLALFGQKDKVVHYELPVEVPTTCVISHHFYVLPMLQVFNGNGRFYLLRLSLKNVELFEGTRDSFQKIRMSEDMPHNMLDVVGEDYDQKSLQYRSGQSGRNQDSGMYHGHGAGKDDKKKEVIKFLRSVESHITSYLKEKDNKAPLVIAAVDYIFGHYKEVNSYKHLYPDNLSGNFDDEPDTELHKKVWGLMENHFRKEIEESKSDYFEHARQNKASNKLDEILRAADIGMIDTLFVEKGNFVWGTYEDEKQKIDLNDGQHLDNECLLDKSAKATFLQGGKVFLVDKEDLPETEAPANAIFRY